AVTSIAKRCRPPARSQTNRLVVPSSRALTTISRSETSCTSTTFGSPTEMRAIAPGCWYRADLPLATEITRSASVSTRWARAAPGTIGASRRAARRARAAPPNRWARKAPLPLRILTVFLELESDQGLRAPLVDLDDVRLRLRRRRAGRPDRDGTPGRRLRRPAAQELRHARPRRRDLARVQRVPQRELDPPFYRRQRQHLRLLRRHQQRHDAHRLGPAVQVLLHLLPRGEDRDVLEDDAREAALVAATAHRHQHVHPLARPHETGHRGHVVDAHAQRPHPLRYHDREPAARLLVRQLRAEQRLVDADRRDYAAAQHLGRRTRIARRQR